MGAMGIINLWIICFGMFIFYEGGEMKNPERPTNIDSIISSCLCKAPVAKPIRNERYEQEIRRAVFGE